MTQATEYGSNPVRLEPAQRRALELLRTRERFLLTGHVRPDGDCIGAQAALASLLRAMGREVAILNPDPAGATFDYLTEHFDFGVYRGGPVPAHDVVVLLDGSDLSRTGPLAEPLRAAPSQKLVVDHHIHLGATWWDEAFTDVSAAATGLLVLRMARALGVELDAAGALGVFTSLVTDTGWFKYSNTDAETLAAAAEMLARGVRPHALFGAIYQRQRPAEPLAIARALARLEYFAGERLACIDLPAPADGEHDLSDADQVLDIVRAVEKVEVVLFVRELSDGRCKLSARAKSDYPVHELAARFGGGGHAKAAGASLPGPLAEAKARLVASVLEDFARGRASAAESTP